MCKVKTGIGLLGVVLVGLASVGPASAQAGSIVAWGYNSDGQLGVPDPNTDFIAVAGGYFHSLGLKADGSIVAWGLNDDGQCDVPLPNAGFVALAAGGDYNNGIKKGYSLGLRADGSIVAWGNNTYGQCNVPDPNTGFVAIAAGWWHSLGLKADGSIVSWGCGGHANLGQCDVPAPNTGFVGVDAGRVHGLGLKADGSIVAWGRCIFGQCNIPDPNTDFIAAAGGGHHSLGLKPDGSIVAWGANTTGQINVPEPNADFVAVAAFGHHSLALKLDRSIVAWGWNNLGQCDVPEPNTDFVAVAAGEFHSLGIKRPPPACDAGGPYTVECGGPVTIVALDGSGSSDPDLGDTLTYLWSTNCPRATFDDGTLESPTLTVPSVVPCGPALMCDVFLTVEDNLGGSGDCSATVTIEDATDPVLNGVPAGVTVECDAVPSPADVTGDDTCDPAPIIDYDEVRTDGSCPDSYTLTRTWTATDSCDNSTQATQIITVQDTTPPILTGVPADMAVECDSVPPPADVTASENCDSDPSVVFDEVQTDGPCEDTYTLTRTWTATDRCGNSSEDSQTITVQDTTDPMIGQCPNDILIECAANAGDVVTFADPDASDNCDTEPTVTCDPPSGSVFPTGIKADDGTTLVTCTAEDNCGNTDSCSFDVTLIACGACCNFDGDCEDDLQQNVCLETGGINPVWFKDADCANIDCEAIPTVSEWGLIVMTLLGCTVGTVLYGRRQRAVV